MKKIFSKKSGFTLVEILVAFVIFAIMAAMILSIARLAVAARASNNEFARDLAVQKEKLVKKDKSKEPKYDSTSGNTDTFNLAFEDGTTVSIDYEVRSADPSSAYVEEGLNYFVPDVIPQSNTPQAEQGGNSGNSQASQYDTRITGTKGFNYIQVSSVQNCGVVDGKVRYIIKTNAMGFDKTILTTQFLPYAQYKIYFRDDVNTTTKEITKDDGTTYIRTMPGVPKILEIGYANSEGTIFKNMNDTNKFKLTKLNNGGVQISYDFTQKNPDYFTEVGGDVSIFYVDFDTDPNLTVSSFGSNAVLDGSAANYSNFVDSKNNTQPNIYGAFEYNDVEKT